MPTYQDYLQHASSKGFQPVSEAAFDYLIKASFNPITNQFIKEDSHA